MKEFIFPRALRVAAKAFADRPKIVGEILVALCSDGRKMKLTETQEYILGECFDEIRERAARRAAEADRKRKQRMGGTK